MISAILLSTAPRPFSTLILTYAYRQIDSSQDLGDHIRKPTLSYGWSGHIPHPNKGCNRGHKAECPYFPLCYDQRRRGRLVELANDEDMEWDILCLPTQQGIRSGYDQCGCTSGDRRLDSMVDRHNLGVHSCILRGGNAQGNLGREDGARKRMVYPRPSCEWYGLILYCKTLVTRSCFLANTPSLI